MLLLLYVSVSTVFLVILPGLNELLHPKTDSDRITALGVEVGLFTMLLVGIQIVIAFRQTNLQERELRIVEQQNAILSRVEDLELLSPMYHEAWAGLGNSMDLFLSITNKGKGTRGVYVHIYLEEHDALRTLKIPPTEQWVQAMSEYIVQPRAVHGLSLTDYTKYFDVLLPGDGQLTTLPPLILLVPAPGEYVVRWRLQSENGNFPKDPVKYGRIELVIFQAT